MKGWMRKLGLGALALSLGVAVGGCDDGGGSGLIRIFFGIVGDGDCARVVVTVDLDDAGATINTDELGAADCDLDSAVSDCSSDFDLDGGTLTVTIDDCTIDEISALFACNFENANIDSVDANTTATCECAGDDCDENPPVCVDRDPDPLSCEDCDNGRDDDGDGLTDCEDPVCANVPPCNANSTTTSTTTTISLTTTTLAPTTTLPPTTTTSSSTTTSVTLPPAFECNILFAIEDDVSVGALQYDVDYADAPGAFRGSGAGVECSDLTGSVASFNDKENEQIMTGGIISIAGVDAPADLAECFFNGTVPPVAEDFAIEVTDATDPSGTTITPTPVVFVKTVDCPTGTTTLPVDTTTTTSTTGPTQTTTTTMRTTTTTMGGGSGSTIVFDIANGDLSFGALQLAINYAAATSSGEFAESSPGVVDCSDSTGSITVFNDITAEDTLNIGYISIAGFSGDRELATCTFTGTPAPGDFIVTVDDAGSPGGDSFDTGTIDVTVSVEPLP